MKGNVYSRQKCPMCAGRLVHDEKRDGCFCIKHPQCGATRFFVRFGKVFKNFSYYIEAYQFLQGLRFKYIEGTFDVRDYQKDSPLGFRTLGEKYIKMKEQQGLRSISNIRNYMRQAYNFWGQKNVKTFNRADLREFLYSIENISEKTRHNYMSCLRDFFRNLVEDEVIDIIQMPRMPKICFDLGYRAITDIDTQTTVLNKIRKISYHVNPKIWLACDMLSLYVNIRPKDLLNMTEGDFDTENGVMTIKRPTKKRGKVEKITVRLIPEHIQEIKDLKKKCPALPHIKFFRHNAGLRGVRADTPFGEKYFYKWAKKACKKLGLKELDLYGLTRHTTVTALAKRVGEEGAKKASGHKTNKAFERYCQYQDNDTFEMVKIAAGMRKRVINFEKKTQK